MPTITGSQGTVSSIQSSQAFVVTPNDNDFIKKSASATTPRPFTIFYNTATPTDVATVQVETFGGDTLTYSVAAGSILGVGMQIKKVFATGTTIPSGNLIAQR